ncbi:hypothetical protein ACIFOT_28740 [Neobacillus sp. NRS-1170]
MKFLKIGIGSNLVVLLAMMLLPAFLVSDQLDVFEKVVSLISEK